MFINKLCHHMGGRGGLSQQMILDDTMWGSQSPLKWITLFMNTTLTGVYAN